MPTPYKYIHNGKKENLINSAFNPITNENKDNVGHSIKSKFDSIDVEFLNQIDLNNKIAVITGGAQGFGYSMVERFTQSGATVAILDKDKDLIDCLDLSENITAVQTDVTSYESVENSTNKTLILKIY